MFFFKKEEIRQIIIDEKKKMLMNECGQRRKCILKLAPTINQSKSKSISHSVSQSTKRMIIINTKKILFSLNPVLIVYIEPEK